MKMDQHKDTSKTSSMPLTRLGLMSMVLSFTSQASAFQSARNMHVAMPAEPGIFGTDSTHRNGAGQHRRKATSVLTRLQYRDGSDESDSTSRFGWFNTIFSNSHQDEANEQDSVDEYLEFLDKRYRRLHTEEQEEPAKPFSAINWLKQGSPTRNDMIATQQQEEDALYVLGVAGLASQKLLHRHHLQVEGSGNTAVADPPASHGSKMDFVDADIVPSGPVQVLIKRVLVPLIRVLYISQRRKEIFVSNQLQRVRSVSTSALRSMGKTFAQGPINVIRTLLDLGGGKRTVTVTLTTLATVFLVLQPILQAAMTEGTVGP